MFNNIMYIYVYRFDSLIGFSAYPAAQAMPSSRISRRIGAVVSEFISGSLT